jgi:pimeloyl-ACP methyl ester carboxylesterase
MKDLHVETSIGRVYGKEAGDAQAPLVLAIHGWSQRNGWHTWEPLIEPLAAAGLHLVAVDMPGWGQSTSTNPGPMKTAEAVATVTALIDAFHAGSATLMGKSWGGGVALQTALDHPALVDRLILTAPAFRTPERLPEVRCPVLLVWSEDDPVIPFSYAAGYLQALPDAELVAYPTGGHSAAPNNAADFAPKAANFVQRK